MSVEYFVAYAATNKEGEQVVGRVAVTTHRITSIERIADLEKLLCESMEVTGVVITSWRRFEPED